MKLRDQLYILKNNPLFKDFEVEYLSKFLQESEYIIKKYGKDDMIFIEDEVCTTLSIVLEGSVEIQKIDSSGKVLTVARFTDGDAFGENLIFGDRNLYPMTVVSKGKTTVLHLPKTSVVKLCQNNTVFLNEFLRTLSNRAVNLSAKLKEVTLKTIRQKICEFLLLRYTETKDIKVKLGMSKKEWADKIGVQRPSLSRELIKMKDEGLIDFDKDTIIILNPDSIQGSL